MTDKETKLRALDRAWKQVVSDSTCVGIRTAGIDVKREYSGEGLGPIAGDFDEIVAYERSGYSRKELGRYPLEDAPDEVPDDIRRKVG